MSANPFYSLALAYAQAKLDRFTIGPLGSEPPLTEGDLTTLREHAVQNALGVLTDSPDQVAFTCDDCGVRYRCGYVFDLYNTNGDCLAEK